MANCFQVPFDMSDYKDIFPAEFVKEYVDHDEILNFREWEKGNVDNCVWKRHYPTAKEIASPTFREQEVTRILRTGVITYIKDHLLWIPPNYYFALQYGKVGADDLEFRLKRLKHVYFKIRARNNPGCVGTLTIKNRADGETTIATTDALHECMDGIMTAGMIGMQSKTRADVINPCWSSVQTTWLNLDKWIKDELFPDFISGDKIAERLRFQRDGTGGKPARNIVYEYFPAVFNAMDGRHNMKKCILDEILKWVECDFGDTFTNYLKFILPGFERRGLFDMFSSPADKDCQSYRDGKELWDKSDTEKMTETGTTQSRIHRYYSNPLEGIQGAYDKWGDADPQRIYDHIMRGRKAAAKDKLLGEIRGFPLNEEEMWGSLEGGDFWDNSKGIKKRIIFLMGAKYKNAQKEPTTIFGNLEWPEGIKDGGEPVFRQSDKTDFDLYDARFCFSYLPQNKEKLIDIKKPPIYVENCIGIDSVDKRYPGKQPSNFAMVNQKFRDIYETGINKCPTMLYLNRPVPIELAYEDAIKAAIFNRAMVQVESLNTKIVDWFEDRGYIDWMLSKIGMPKNSLMKGDAPSGKTAFLDEIIGLLNGATSLPINPGDPYLLDRHWIIHILEDLIKFNKKDTHANDASMGWGQALMGSVKLLFEKRREPSDFNTGIMEYLFD